MRRINYPPDLENFKQDYLTYIPELGSKALKWGKLWRSTPSLRNNFPKGFGEILMADYDRLVAYYLAYRNLVLDNDLIRELKNLFDYDKCQPHIARFFMAKAEELELSVCHYCETAYINAYNKSRTDILESINSSSPDELKTLLRIGENNVNKVLNRRPFASAEDFNAFWSNEINSKTEDKFGQILESCRKNHFDLDHVLDKGRCPIVGLSVMNFVPSCQVCNEKLKKSKLIGDNLRELPIDFLSPTSPDFDFERNVTILPVSDKWTDGAYAMANKDRYSLEFICDKREYEDFIELFDLRERYQFHKVEALYWLELCKKYDEAALNCMAKALEGSGITAAVLREDIFREEYDKVRKPCFLKMKRDVLLSSGQPLEDT